MATTIWKKFVCPVFTACHKICENGENVKHFSLHKSVLRFNKFLIENDTGFNVSVFILICILKKDHD